MLCGSFFRWYFNKSELNCRFLWNAMVPMAQAILCFDVFNFRCAIDSLVYRMKRFSIDTDRNSLSVNCSEMASSKNVFLVRSFRRFIDEIRRFKGLVWQNIVAILSGLRLNFHTTSSNSACKRKNTKICKMVLSRNVQFFKDNPNSF